MTPRQKEQERLRARKAAARARGRKLIEAARARARKVIEVARARARQWLVAASKPTKRKVRTVRTQTTRKMPTGIGDAKAQAIVRSALQTASHNEKPGALISVASVRKLASLSKSAFDQAALDMMRAGELTLTEHDFPASLAPSTLHGLVQDAKGRAFNGMAFVPMPGLLSVARSYGPDEERLLTAARRYGPGKPVRIAALRKDLIAFEPARFDQALAALQQAGRVALYRDDNRVTAEREGAYFVAGEPRHILYVRDGQQ